MIKKIVFASKNKGKIREVRQLFSSIDVEIVEAPENFDAIEDGETFLDNAIIKAREAARLTGNITLADDSGLIVDALNGRPGVHSSRYAKDDQSRIVKLLNEMKDIPDGARQARFVCSMVLVAPDASIEHSTSGVCEGNIIFEPKGKDGFGFDPVFFVPEVNMTMAEIPLEKKNTISHRAKALTQMLKWIENNK